MGALAGEIGGGLLCRWGGQEEESEGEKVAGGVCVFSLPLQSSSRV